MTKRFCAQRGCAFDLEDVVTKPAELEADGVTVRIPAETSPAPLPELCPTCGHPFLEHPDPSTL